MEYPQTGIDFGLPSLGGWADPRNIENTKTKWILINIIQTLRSMFYLSRQKCSLVLGQLEWMEAMRSETNSKKQYLHSLSKSLLVRRIQLS